MGIFSLSDIDKVNKVASKSKELNKVKPSIKSTSIHDDIQAMSENVIDYFKDSDAILITDKYELEEYIDACIDFGYAGIDTETTGLDRTHDTVVGSSLYVPGKPECYIPNNHLVPIFDTPYKNQLTYEEVGEQFQRLVDNGVKLIFANADFDLAMIYKDFKVDLLDSFYYDVILAWRCLKEDERDNTLKGLYNKYVLKGEGDPRKFSDFFSVQLFPYCKPEVAKLYAANDARITFDLFKWQLPYITKSNDKCRRANLQAIADLVWNVEFPLVRTCQMMHRNGIYVDKEVASKLHDRYKKKEEEERQKLCDMIDELIATSDYSYSAKRPFASGADFNPKSTVHVKYLVYNMLNVPSDKGKMPTDKNFLGELNIPVTNQILKLRSLGVLMSTFIEKMPKSTTPDSRIHAEFKQIGAATGRFSSQNPNLQNIPSHADDVRHMFRATPGYVMISSDYSSQEPRLTAYVSQDPKMIKAFQEDRDIYATIASLAFGVPYERCLEFHPVTGEYQADGKKRRGEAKIIVLGVTYGRSVPAIGEQLYGTRTDMSEKEKTAGAQKVYDAVMHAFPNLRRLMISAQRSAKRLGYTETVLGRRRHLPDMQLEEFEFLPKKGYVNPDVDPLDVTTLANKDKIPDRIVNDLRAEFKEYKYFGQIAKRIRELDEENIRVINNRPRINDASRQVVNGIIQGSAADQTKLALLKLDNNEEWNEIGGRLIVPVHDEIIAEVPIEHWKRGGEILSSMMVEAADFLPFPSKCDVTTTLRWYGREYPCKYSKPSSLNNMTEDNIKWLQWHISELEYILPVIKEEGEDVRGDALFGINGKMSDELTSCIDEYKKKYKVSSDEEFIDHLEQHVVYGRV